MSLYGFAQGHIVTVEKLLAAGSNDILAISATAFDVEVAEVFIANSNAASRTLLLTRFDGTTAYTLLPTKSIAANDTLHVTFPFTLPKGWTLRGTPSAASDLTVHVTYVKPIK